VTAYSIHSQLPSILGGRLLYPRPENALCRCDRDPHGKDENDDDDDDDDDDGDDGDDDSSMKYFVALVVIR